MIIIYFLLGFLFLSLFLKWFLSLFSSKFKLYFLFGKKGSGKSTLLVKLMHRYAKKGYVIYTNMMDCLYPMARIIDIKLIGDFIPPPKSFLALDEVGMEYDARKFKQFRDNTRDFYKLQRHYKVVVAMASQTWDVDKKVRDLCDEFYLCSSFGPISIGKRIVKRMILTDARENEESRPSENLKYASVLSWYFTWIPSWVRFFDSFDAPPRPFLPYFFNPQKFWMDFKKRGKSGDFKGVKIKPWLPKKRRAGVSLRRSRKFTSCYKRLYKTRFKS